MYFSKLKQYKNVNIVNFVQLRENSIVNLPADSRTITKLLCFSALPQQCSNGCWCHYLFEANVNVLDCSHTNVTSLTQIRVPNETLWLVAKYNHIPNLQWSENLDTIQHFDLQHSGVRNITDDFFSKIKHMKKRTFLNLANNYLSVFPKSLNGTSFSQVYLARNPIDCNCEMLWFANWLNVTEPDSENRIVKDYDQVLCVGGKWNGTQVYKLSAEQMGCYPKIIAK